MCMALYTRSETNMSLSCVRRSRPFRTSSSSRRSLSLTMWSVKSTVRAGRFACRQISVEAGNVVFGRSGKQFHPMWLRERCVGPASVQQETLQAFRQPHEFPADLGIVSAQVSPLSDSGVAPRTLTVGFTDGHVSVFDADALNNEADDFAACGIQQSDIKCPDVFMWDKSTGSDVPRLSYLDVASGQPEVLLKLTTHLLRYGHVIVEGVPSRDGEVAAFARVVSEYPSVRPTNWGPVFNVRSFPDAALKDLSYTAEKLSPHVDNPYRNPNPGFQFLHVLENECASGESLAVDGFMAAEQLRLESPAFFKTLCQTDVRWENDGGDRSTALIHFAPMLEVDKSSGKLTQIRYSPKSGGYCPALSMEEADTFFQARRRFAELLHAESNMVRFQMVKGDLWIFNNLRLLHGRSEFNPHEGFRHLQGSYVDADAVTSAFFRAKYALKASSDSDSDA
ncbi:unnamed protein product [Polarella glacialis]|uniref:TauD/TfdA-like domain-containing protein n=1 Tax=Polarella glacialis TaxID=89957 RepID=A0A813GZ35_POLGL|nr:unnamed protein product [Polarella glacialis]CAE8720969.1 unnamed protein product [Polarella glacialis]